jgi:hypothetical protein
MPTPDFSKVWASNSPLPEYTFSDADYLTGWDFVGSAPPTKNEFDAWFKMVDTKLNWLYGQLQDTASKLYPVGSVYISFNSADPSTLFGGAWTRLKDTFLLANGDSYAPNTTGGSATKNIAIANLPAHNHTVNASGTHNHTASTSSSGVHSHSASTGGAGGHTHSASSNTTGNHSHTRGDMNITGSFSADNTMIGTEIRGSARPPDGAFTGKELGSYDLTSSDTGNGGRLEFNASRSWTGSTSTNGNHAHTITVNAVGNHTHTVSIANGGGHTHTVTVNNNGSHTHTTNNTGGGTPLNILPPYMTVYMWRRTA